jgi:glycine/D-amino acid oxidase-like deaminating enzyme
MRVSIIGGGISGLSLAWSLRRRGVAVSLFEQGSIPNPVSSSFDEHRITRHVYGGLEGYGALMPHAFAAYDRLWADLGVSHYHPTGMVFIAREPMDWYDRAAAELDQLSIAHRPLSAEDISVRLPMMRQDGIFGAFQAEGAGMLFASRIVTDLAKWLADHGADLHPHSRVDSFDPQTARVVANGRTHDADILVIAAGAWLPKLHPAAAGRLVASRQTVIYLRPPPDLAEAWAGAPVIADAGQGQGSYFLPPREGTRLKVGGHSFTRLGDGDDDRDPRDSDVSPVLADAARALARFDEYEIFQPKVCYYTVTEDERFVVEPIGSVAWVLSACSGHGFKLGPLIASGLADALTGGRDASELPDWAAGRALAAVPG